MPKSRIFLYTLLSFIAGVGIRSLVALPIALVWIGVIAAAFFFAYGILRNRSGLIYGLFILSACAGAARFEYMDRSRHDLSSLIGPAVEIEGIIKDEPEFTEKSQRIILKANKAEGGDVSPFNIAIVTRRYPAYRIGDKLLAQGAIEEPRAKFSPPNMIFPHITSMGRKEGKNLKWFLVWLKQSFDREIEEILPEPHAAFLKGLILGERESLPRDFVSDLQKTGTTHIVALSGYNITIIARFVIMALLGLAIPFRVSFWIATAAIMGFVALTGASPSAVRAGIMGILVLVAEREGRAYQITNALIFAAALMILHDPTILRFDAAFQLSFLATLGLIYLAPVLEKMADRMRPVFREKPRGSLISARQTLIETLSAQLMVLPLLIYLFGKISLVSPLANVLILVAIPYTMALGFFAVLFNFFLEPAGWLLAAATWLLLEYKIQVIALFAKVPLSSVEISKVFFMPFLFFYGWLIFLIAKKQVKQNPAR